MERVEEITFGGEYARRRKQPVLYVTERTVFHLGEDGVELLEIAPGVDLEREVLGQMEFRPKVSPELKTIEPRLYGHELMGLRAFFDTHEHESLPNQGLVI